MHTWKPDAYSEAPVPVAVMLAAGVLNCALYGLVRFYILTSKCLGPQFGSQLLIVFGLLSMGVAVPFVLVQRSFRRLLAYSSIDHCGIMVLALGFGGPLGILGMFLHMTFHADYQALALLLRGQHPTTPEYGSVPQGKGRPDPFDALDRSRISDGSSCRHRVASFQPVPERVHNSARGVRGRTLPSSHSFRCLSRRDLLRVSGAHRKSCSGCRSGSPPAETCRWKKYSVLGLASVIIVLGFWIPGPLFRLIQGAADIVVSAR